MKESEAPQSFRQIREIFLPLAEAQRRRHFPDRFVLNRYHVIDSDEFQAFIVQSAERGQPGLVHDVYVSRKALHAFFADDEGKVSRESMRAGQVHLAGALAHELAHPIDAQDPKGFEREGEREAGDWQLVETRTDMEGALLAEEAGFPRDVVYRCLEHVSRGERGKGWAGSAYLSTHPQWGVRLTANRVFLTLQRYQRGESTKEEVLTPPRSALADEMKQHGIPRKPEESLERLLASIQKRYDRVRSTSSQDRQDFTEFFERFGHALTAQKGALADEQIRAVAQQLLVISQHRNNDYLVDRIAFHRSGAHQLDEEDESRTGLSRLNESGVLEHPAFRAAVSLEIQRLLSGDLPPLTLVRRLVTLVPQSELSEGPIAEKVLERWMSELGKTPPGAAESLNSFVFLMGFRGRMKFLKTAFDKAVGNLPPAEFVRFYKAIPNLNWENPGPRDSGFGEVSARIDPLRFEREGSYRTTPEEYVAELTPEAREAFRSAAQAFWRRPAESFIVAMARIGTPDWELMAHLDGLTLGQAARQMSQGIRELARRPKDSPERVALRAMANERSLYVHSEKALTLRLDRGLVVPLIEIVGQEYGYAYLKGKPTELREYFSERADEVLSKAQSIQGIRAGFRALHLEEEFHQALDILARKITQQAGWTEERKQKTLSELFLSRHQDPFGNAIELVQIDGKPKPWVRSDLSKKGIAEVVGYLKRLGVIEKPSDLLENFFDLDKDGRWITDPDSEFEGRQNEELGYYHGRAHAEAVNNLTGVLVEEIAEIAALDAPKAVRHKRLKRSLERVFVPYNGRYLDKKDVNDAVSAIQSEAVRAAQGLELSVLDRIELHRVLVHLGATPRTDALLDDCLKDLATRPATREETQALRRIAERQRVHGRETELRLGLKLLEPRVQRLEKEKVTSDKLAKLFAELHEYVPKASAGKNQWIEGLAYRLRIEDIPSLEFLESQKSTNWKTASPYLLQSLSAWAAEMQKTSRQVRLDVIDYLLKPEIGFPKSFFAHMSDRVLGRKSVTEYLTPERIREMERDMVRPGIEKLDAMVKGLSAQEKLVLVELCLTVGEDPISGGKHYPNDVLRRFMHLKPGSEKAKSLRAFLASVPETERSVSMAHFLTHSGSDTSGVRESFEVFGTPGKKAGQATATFKLLPDALLEELEEFKDDATPMTKVEIRKTLKRELHPSEYAQIERVVEVIGSASIKTAALVELKDGTRAVALLQAPDAAAQTDSHLQFANNFLAEMKAEGMQSHSALADRATRGLAAQMDNELDFLREAEEIRRAKSTYDRVNRDMDGQMDGWAFKVPALHTGFTPKKKVLVLDLADGQAYGKLPESPEKQVAGRLILEGTLRSIFDYGVVNPDPHKRNVKVNTVKKEIYPLDFGQQTTLHTSPFPWAADDRWHLAEILRGAAEKDSARLLKGVKAVSTGQVPEGLKGDLQAAIERPGTTRERILHTLETLARHEVEIPDRFFFGAAKALLTLGAESYADEQEFTRRLATQVQGVYYDKCLRSLGDLRSGWTKQLQTVFGSF